MGKKKAGVRNGSPTALAAVEDHTASTEVARLKEEGNRLFGRKDYQKALDSYDKALKAAGPEATSETPLLHSNKAACYMMLTKFKEAVNECTDALDVDPAFLKALLRRAKAYEAMGHYKQALHDYQKANKADSANPDTQEAEKRLKDIVTGKRTGNGMVANGVARKGSNGRQKPQMLVYTVKCTLEGETRQLHLVGTTTYAELLDNVRAKFPAAPPFLLKFLDREGDPVTMTDRRDIEKALHELVDHAERMQASAHGARANLQALLPPLRLTLVPVSSEAEVPAPPADEIAQLESMQQARRLLQAQAQASQRRQAAEAEAAVAGAEEYQLDQWLVDFAGLFRDVLGVEPDKHLDLNAYGWEKLQRALETAVRDEKAVSLFDAAATRFEEVTLQGLVQWGYVYLCMGKRLVEKAAYEGTPLADVAEEAEEQFKRAEGRYLEALRISPKNCDAKASIASLDFERAKLAAGFVTMPLKPEGEKKKEEGSEGEVVSKEPALSKEAEQKALEEQTAANLAATQALTKEALAKLTPEGMDGAEPLFARAWEGFKTAIGLLPPEEQGKPMKPQQPAEAGAPPAEEEQAPWANCQVMWGNLQFEYSQMLAAVGRPWKAVLDEAVGRFRAAGCPEADIRQALSQHTQAEHIDLGPEPTLEAPPAAEEEVVPAKPAAEEVEAKEVKGLPALAPKKKTKPASEAKAV